MFQSEPHSADTFEQAFLGWRRRSYRPGEIVLVETAEREADRLLKGFLEQRFFTKHLLRAFERGKVRVGNGYLRPRGEQRMIFGGTLEHGNASLGCFQLCIDRTDSGLALICPLHLLDPNERGLEVRAQFLGSLALLAPQIGAEECRVLGLSESRHLLTRMDFDFVDDEVREGYKNALATMMEHFKLGTAPPLHSAADLGRLEISGRLPSAYRLWVRDDRARAGFPIDDRQSRVVGQAFGRMLFLSRDPWWGVLRGEALRAADKPAITLDPTPEASPPPSDLGGHMQKLVARLGPLTNSVLSPLVPLLEAASPDTPVDPLALAAALQSAAPYQRRLEALAAEFERIAKTTSEPSLATTRKVLARWGILRHHRSEFLQRVTLEV